MVQVPGGTIPQIDDFLVLRSPPIYISPRRQLKQYIVAVQRNTIEREHARGVCKRTVKNISRRVECHGIKFDHPYHVSFLKSTRDHRGIRGPIVRNTHRAPDYLYASRQARFLNSASSNIVFRTRRKHKGKQRSYFTDKQSTNFRVIHIVLLAIFLIPVFVSAGKAAYSDDRLRPL